MLRPRQAASLFSEKSCMGVPATVTAPDDGRSIPAIMLSKVDLPLPDLPTTPTNSPAPIWRSIFVSAEKTPAGVSYFLLTWCKEIIGCVLYLARSIRVQPRDRWFRRN